MYLYTHIPIDVCVHVHERHIYVILAYFILRDTHVSSGNSNMEHPWISFLQIHLPNPRKCFL